MSKSKGSPAQPGDGRPVRPRRAQGAPDAARDHHPVHPVQVKTNLFRVGVHDPVRHVHVLEITPPVEGDALREDLLSTLLARHHVSPFLLKGNKVYLVQAQPELRDTVTPRESPTSYTLTLRYEEAADLTQDARVRNDTLAGILHAAGLEPVGRNYCTPPEATQSTPASTSSKPARPTKAANSSSLAGFLPSRTFRTEGLEVVRGLSAAVHPSRILLPGRPETSRVSKTGTRRPSTGSLLLELDIIARVLHATPASTIVRTLRKKGWTNARIGKFFHGRVIRTNYNGRTYRVDGLDFTRGPMSTFKMTRGPHAGEDITLQAYAQRRYGVQVTEADQPVLFTRAGDCRLEFLPELCSLTGLNARQRTNYRFMRELARVTNVEPGTRGEALERVAASPALQERFHQWGLDLDPRMLDVTGVRLPPRAIQCGKNKRLKVHPARCNWQAGLNRARVWEPRALNKWALLYPAKDLSREKANRLAGDMQAAGRAVGMRVSRPKLVPVQDFRAKSQELTSLVKPGGKLRDREFALTVSPTEDKRLYGFLKRAFLAPGQHGGLGIPHQNALLSTVTQKRHREAILRNLMRQVNAKLGADPHGLGGTAWVVNPAPLPPGTMVIGLDVTHSPDPRRPSVAGFAATLDQTGTHYFATPLPAQPHGKEIVDARDAPLARATREALQAYHALNNTYPARLVVYRDGVGWTNFERVKARELAQVEAACRAASPDPVKICILNVHKRVRRRFLARGKDGRFRNPRPGVTCPASPAEFRGKADDARDESHEDNDGRIETETDSADDNENDNDKRSLPQFFLVSHDAPVGTVKPTHYVVLHNETALARAALQELTFALCHLNQNWPGTTRVPAPVEYAHKTAFLCGQTRLQQVARGILNTNFFL